MDAGPTAVGDLVYVKDAQLFEWLPARVVETASPGATKLLVTIELPPTWDSRSVNASEAKNGETLVIDLNDYWNHQLPRQNSDLARDMAELPYLSEAAILYQIKDRHALGKPYTRVGEIIVAVNPCKESLHLYNQKQKELYANSLVWDAVTHSEETLEERKENEIATMTSSSSFAKDYERLGFEPHVYEASAFAYHGMITQQKNQIIVVSGESGAGKTETVKIVVEHLVQVDQTSPSTKIINGSASSNAVLNVIESSHIFEAFGNAKTLMNNNSSRFGKVTRLHYLPNTDGVYTIVGSSYKTYLLEGSRIVTHSPGERSFHIFYQILSGSDDFKRRYLGPEWAKSSPTDFRMLDESGDCIVGDCDDKMLLKKTLDALEKFGFVDEQLEELIQALGVVLRLRNIRFSEREDADSYVENSDDLGLLEAAIGIDRDALEAVFTSKTINTQIDEVEVALSVTDARHSLDSFSKYVYAIIFESLVGSINAHTLPSEVDGDQLAHIALLDIYGFESFESNRFEQLCINYANEKLQHKYVQDKLLMTRTEFENEGIQMFDVSAIDNSDVLDLFESSTGLIAFMNQECVRKNGCSKDFVFNLKARNDSSQTPLVATDLHRPTEFGIAHYAGLVTYDASEFVERNSYRLPQKLLDMGSESDNSIIRDGFSKLIAHESNKSSQRTRFGKKRHMSTLDIFRLNLNQLVSSMHGAQTRYIRCIKPNVEMLPMVTDHKLVMKQIRCSGLVTAVELSREIFPSKLSFAAVVDRFTCLLPRIQQDCLKELADHDKVQVLMSSLFTPYIEQFQTGNFSMPFACGRSKVFYRSGALEFLEKRRNELLTKAITSVQALFRMVLAKRVCYRILKAVVQVQSNWRRQRAINTHVKAQKAILLIQSQSRVLLGKKHYFEIKESAAAIQRTLKSYRTSQQRCRRHSASTAICTFWRKSLAMRSFVSRKSSATRIESWWRCQLQVRKWGEQKKALVIIQKHLRSLSKSKSTLRNIVVQSQEGRISSSKVPNDECNRMENQKLEKCMPLGLTEIFSPEASSNIKVHDDQGMEMESKRLDESVPKGCTGVVSTEVLSASTPRKACEHIWQNDALVQRLKNENKRYLEEIASLRADITQLSSEVEDHNKAVECEYEEKLVNYEQAVLLLKQEVGDLETERIRLVEQAELGERDYKRKLANYKRNLVKHQAANKKYLIEVHEVFEQTNKSRHIEAERFSKELRTQAGVVRNLKQQVEQLKTQQSTCTDIVPVCQNAIVPYDHIPSATMEARQLVDDLIHLTSQARISDHVSHIDLLSRQRIEQEVSEKVRMIGSRLLDMVESSEEDGLDTRVYL